jgi:hypothetical protein
MLAGLNCSGIAICHQWLITIVIFTCFLNFWLYFLNIGPVNRPGVDLHVFKNADFLANSVFLLFFGGCCLETAGFQTTLEEPAAVGSWLFH